MYLSTAQHNTFSGCFASLVHAWCQARCVCHQPACLSDGSRATHGCRAPWGHQAAGRAPDTTIEGWRLLLLHFQWPVPMWFGGSVGNARSPSEASRWQDLPMTQALGTWCGYSRGSRKAPQGPLWTPSVVSFLVDQLGPFPASFIVSRALLQVLTGMASYPLDRVKSRSCRRRASVPHVNGYEAVTCPAVGFLRWQLHHGGGCFPSQSPVVSSGWWSAGGGAL